LFATEEGNRGFSESHPESKSANEDGKTAEGDSARVDGNSERAGPKGGRGENRESFPDRALRNKRIPGAVRQRFASRRRHYVFVMKKVLFLISASQKKELARRVENGPQRTKAGGPSGSS
jgi:hypothetical protein